MLHAKDFRNCARRSSGKRGELVLAIFLIIAVICIASCFTACFKSGESSTEQGSASGGTSGGNNSSKTPAPSAPVSIPTDKFTVVLREDSAKVTDSGRAYQKMDTLLISNYFSVTSAYNSGYTKLNVTISLEAKEIDSGYQYVFLYADKNCKSNTFFDKVLDEFYDPADPSLLYEYRFEHGGTGKANTSWAVHEFSTTIMMNRLKDDLYIRYGASGKNDDDWQNRNIKATFWVSK